MKSISRRGFLAAAGLTALAGCSSRGSTTGGTTPDAEGSGGTDDGGSASVPTAGEHLPLPMAADEIRTHAEDGGPPKDGIPSIDEPQFVEPGDADFLEPDDPVFGVARDGAVKAYPQKILSQHEVVNDELGGTSVAVTYCPLTGTVQGFERGDTTFGVSGQLVNNNLVMYDRATEAWWPQILATRVPGPWNGDVEVASLREFRLVWTTWRRWRKHHPDTRVLSTETGHAKNYNRDPYGSYNPRGGYYENDNLLFAPLNTDDRFDRKRVVMGARTPEGAAAFLKDALRENGLMAGEIGDTPVLAVHDARFDTAYVYRNPEGASFDVADGSIVGDDGTSYDPDGLPLTRIHTFDAMWFAWAGYYPDTEVYA